MPESKLTTTEPGSRPELAIAFLPQELKRQGFVAKLRSHIMNELTPQLRERYEDRVLPDMLARGERPATGDDIHRAMQAEPAFRDYTALRLGAQELVWESVIPGIRRNLPGLTKAAEALTASARALGYSLDLEPELEVPKNVASIDVHLQPGSYHTESGPEDVYAGALYEQGLRVFSMGLFGPDGSGVGEAIAAFIAHRHPDFAPGRILDLGCTIGQSTRGWVKQYPSAEVHGIDVAAPCLRYGFARAMELGLPLNMHQQDATRLQAEDQSFDIVCSHMFLHELSQHQIRQVFEEAYRVLKPGGLMVHMEYPPEAGQDPFDCFVMNWSAYYVNEPFMKAYRRMDTAQACAAAGFDLERYFEMQVPSIAQYGEGAHEYGIMSHGPSGRGEIGEQVGRFNNGLIWYAFGCWKQD